MRRPRCPISRDPRREDHTTCTAVTPGVVFTVRMYGTRPLVVLARRQGGSPLPTMGSAPCTYPRAIRRSVVKGRGQLASSPSGHDGRLLRTAAWMHPAGCEQAVE